MVAMIKMCAISNVIGEKLSEENETLLCLKHNYQASDEESQSQFHEGMSLAVRSTLEVLEHRFSQ